MEALEEVLRRCRGVLELRPADGWGEARRVCVNLAGGYGGRWQCDLGEFDTAILRPIAQANQALDKSERGLRLRLQTVEFIELYEDRAVESGERPARICIAAGESGSQFIRQEPNAMPAG